VLLGSLLANESLTIRILAASVIIIGSVVFTNSAHKSKPEEAVHEAEPLAAD
jgi:hypothetical protein